MVGLTRSEARICTANTPLQGLVMTTGSRRTPRPPPGGPAPRRWIPAAGSCPPNLNGKLLDAEHGVLGEGELVGAGRTKLPEPVEQEPEGDIALDPRKPRAEAEMDAVPEGELPVGLAPEVEP